MRRIVFAMVLLLLSAAGAAAQDDCAALYQKVTANYKGDAAAQKVAYEASVAYLDRCRATNNTEQYTWVTRFKLAYGREAEAQKEEAEMEALDVEIAETYKAKDWPRFLAAVTRARQFAPNSLGFAWYAGMTGIWSRNKQLFAQSAEAARAALKLIDAGGFERKTEAARVHDFGADMTRGKMTGQLNYALGYYLFHLDVKQARPYLKAALAASDEYKTSWQFFELLARVYENADYEPLRPEYKICFGSESADCLINRSKMALVLPPIVDALARAYLLTTDAGKKAEFRTELEAFYKINHNGLTGLDELLKTVLSKPVYFL